MSHILLNIKLIQTRLSFNDWMEYDFIIMILFV